MLRAVLSAALVAGALIAVPAAPALAAAPEGSAFTSTSPVRVLDTRTTGLVGAGGTVAVDLSDRVPASATAVVLNVTGVAPTASTFVTAYPGGAPRPTASSLNLDAGEVRANQVTVALGADRTVRLYNKNGRINLVADLAGHYGTEAASLFTGLSPNRLLDTRQNTPVAAGQSRILDLSGAVPESATAVTFNLTAVSPTASTFVTAYPAGAPRPTASNLNVVAGETRPNQVTVAIGENRHVSLFNNSGTVHLLADVTGFYTPDYGSRFVPRTPTRVLDTRAVIGFGGPLQGGYRQTLGLYDHVPVTATGVVLNLTGVDATTSTYVTAWGMWTIQPYFSSSLNLVPGKAVSNAATVTFGPQRGMDLYNHRGLTDLVADLSGMFTVSPSDCEPGCVRAWGRNDTRKLGTAQTVDKSATPTPVLGLSGVRQVVGGGWSGASYAVLDDGTVRAWGANGTGQLGNGWSGSFDTASPVPVPVLGLTDVTTLATNGRTTFAVRADGSLWGWGEGPFGNGGYNSASLPAPVPDLTDVVDVAVGYGATYVLKADGTVWTWGTNGSGELGTGSPSHDTVLTPVRIPALSDVTALGAGAYTGYAVTADGSVWAWGSNDAGALGTGQVCAPTGPCESRVPVRVAGLTDVARVAAGGATYALRTDGTVAAWGFGANGALGNGVLCDGTCVTPAPVDVVGLTEVTAIAAYGGGLALRADGTVWAWGDNGDHALGQEFPSYSLVPVQVPGVSGATAIGGGVGVAYAVS